MLFPLFPIHGFLSQWWTWKSWYWLTIFPWIMWMIGVLHEDVKEHQVPCPHQPQTVFQNLMQTLYQYNFLKDTYMFRSGVLIHQPTLLLQLVQLQSSQNFYFFIYGSTGSLLLRGLFSYCRKGWLLSSHDAQASHRGGFSCCWARALGNTSFSSCRRGLSTCSSQAQ